MSASPERPASTVESASTVEQPQPEASTSNNTAPAPRSILSMLGGQPRSNPLALNPDPAKRRKKNPEPTTQQTQGRIVLNPSNGAAWKVEKRPEEVIDAQLGGSIANGKAINGRGKGKGKGKSGGEEDELKEMGKKAKAAQKGRGGKRNGPGKRQAGDNNGQLELKAHNGDDDEDDPLLLKDHALDQDRPNIPTKKKRGRPPKLKPPSEGGPSRRSTRSASTTTDSHHIPYVRSSSPNDIVVTGGSQNGSTKTGPRRPKHPVLSRANTTSTTDLRGQTHNDAIDVERTTSPVKAGPKKLVFASDAKPAHSFFSRPTPTTSAAPIQGTTETTTANGTAPISEPKPEEVVAPIYSPKKVHNFFQPARSDAKTTAMKNGWGHGIKEGEEWIPPWPGGDWPVHSGVVDTSYQAGPSRPRRPIPEARTCHPADGFWQSFMKHADESGSSDNPSPRRASTLPPANGDRESFCDRFRPKTAAQVLGNVTEATYLRDWLSTLVVGTKDGSGPRVIRKVPKRRLKLDDWIVDDIGEFGEEEPEEEVEMPEPFDESDVPMGVRPNTYAPLSTWLTNTILLSGPSGSGKSAAVYAAAIELGWEVFEVYPGIGKRTGGNLMSLVGDVGKNHMVGKAKEAENTKPSPAGLKTFFRSTTKDVDIAEEVPPGSQGEPIEIDDDHPERPATPPPPRLRNPSISSTPFRDEAKFRQSLILLEEVDILFDEEATFWPAVIALIAESKRPVVMTCNERVVLDALPLQAILQFKPAPRNLATAHLASLCAQLGLDRDQVYLEGLYERSIVNPPQSLRIPGPPNGNEWLPSFDLRRAIMQLQLERGVPIHNTPSAHPDIDDLAIAFKRAEVISYTDAHLAERSWATMELSEIDRYEPTPDDQLGVATLLKPELPDHIPTLPAYDRTSEIATFLFDNVGGAPPPDDMFTNQIHYIRSLLPLLDPIIPLSSRLLPHPNLFTEYMPVIQHLVQTDDIRQAHYDACKAAGIDLRNIKTGRPVRVTAWVSQEYVRDLPLEEEALQIARRTLRYE